MEKELKEIIEMLNNNDRRLDGEDGGIALNVLATHLSPVGIINAGRIDFGGETAFSSICELMIRIYNYGDWKFVVQDYVDAKPVHDGGTVYTGTVDLYNIKEVVHG